MQKAKSLDVMLHTNGIAMDPDLAKGLIKSGLNELYFLDQLPKKFMRKLE